MKLRFLLDEHLSTRIVGAVLRLDPTIEICRIGDPGAPPLQTQDPDILRFAEAAQQALVCRDYATIPTHALEHIAAGGQHWGIFLLRPQTGIGQLAEALYLLWEGSDATEWINRVAWLPF
jgi:hypothetical protein